MKVQTYIPGHSANATEFMSKRTVGSHGQFFAPYLQSGLKVLDCGCGPGSITLGIAERVSPADVVGVDFGQSQITNATAAAASVGYEHVTFQVADCCELPFADGSFDRVFSHALLEHLSNPIKALTEMHRVLKPGGIIGVCSPDWGGFVLSPPSPELSKAVSAYTSLQNDKGGDVEAGRKLGVHLAKAGFVRIEMAARYECYPSLEFIGEYLALQLEREGDATSARALRDWSGRADGLFAQAWISAVGFKAE